MSHGKQDKSNSAHWKSTITAAILEVAFFHPFDTMQKRFQNNPNPIYDFSKPIKTNLCHVYDVACRNPKTKNFSLYPGLNWAGVYKLLQRGLKFGGQPYVEKFLQTNVFSESNKIWATGFSGAIMGAGEVVLLPLDIYKIRKQTGSEDTGISYRALHVTVLRNIIGSFLLFGVPQLLQTKIARDEKLSRTEKAFTHAIGAAACLIASNPLDVIKTRMQADKNSIGALATACNIAVNHPSQFGRSLGLKTVAQGFKLTFFMSAKDRIEEMFQEQEARKLENESFSNPRN